ncbi:Fip1-domain-containing protein [Parathielavia appendiculata]|uniref:Fip1-domain-containing protein n=1 Tax=Parathielavia appendiculata TaxID=2587402 RepID=A0AAN6TVF8_9PEZI|nr:Fip1-domain-containing protein [Parathielavia appendiculata]
MDIDDEDDFYAPEEPQAPAEQAPAEAPPDTTKKDANEELEEGEEEDEGGAMDEDEDSDIDIITERKDGSKPAPPPQSRYSEIKNIPQRTAPSDTSPTTTSKPSQAPKPTSSSIQADTHPAVSTSKIDVNAIPIHKFSNKPLTQVNIDEDLPPENDKPWRKPGTDLSDYFNYGFDEFTWALYAQKQEALRAEYNPEAIAERNKKMMEDMTNFMMMGGMAGMPPVAAAAAANPAVGGGAGAGAGVGSAGAGGMPQVLQGMPGMEGMTPEMHAMMQSMMGAGMDPSQMDMSAMAGMFGGAGAGGGGPGQGGQGPSFGGGFGGGQGQGYGYEQQMGGGGGGRGGRGRGRRW